MVVVHCVRRRSSSCGRTKTCCAVHHRRCHRARHPKFQPTQEDFTPWQLNLIYTRFRSHVYESISYGWASVIIECVYACLKNLAHRRILSDCGFIFVNQHACWAKVCICCCALRSQTPHIWVRDGNYVCLWPQSYDKNNRVSESIYIFKKIKAYLI